MVDNVKFGLATGIGGYLGYRLDGPLSEFVEYQYLGGQASWDATFPLFGVSSTFDATAIGNALLASIAYDLPLSPTTGLTIAGASLNTCPASPRYTLERVPLIRLLIAR
ncbi:hypothetical protein [Devosia faecipullorum]|uniref:hypothetical protein n=1 Tax=Devosia faecipullorum TaxID=2755039 RepID=UPI00187B3D13|nr:hypothetical protein [Devosia faecipullorum]MBE7731929.1 hypothetical protein [Devosia faecipullorum]